MIIRSILALGFLAALGGCSNPSSTPPGSDWKTYGSEKFGLSLESPFALEFKERSFELPSGVPVKGLESKVQFDKPKPLQFILDILAQQFTKEVKVRFLKLEVEVFELPKGREWNAEALLDSQESGLRQGFKEKGEGFDFKRTGATCSGFPARQLEGTFKLKVNPLAKPHLRSSTLTVTQGNRLWNVSFLCGDIEEYRALKDRVFRSLKVVPSAP
jgi:hypothetical protein